MKLVKLPKIDLQLNPQSIQQRVVEMIKQDPQLSGKFNNFVEGDFFNFFNIIFSNIMGSLDEKINYTFNNHFPSTVYDENNAYNVLDVIGIDPTPLREAVAETTLIFNEDVREQEIIFNSAEEIGEIPFIYRIQGNNRNGEANFWELLIKDNNGEFNYKYGGKFVFNHSNMTELYNGKFKFNNKVNFYSGVTETLTYFADGVNNEKVVIANDVENIQLESIRVYKQIGEGSNKKLIPMYKTENFIQVDDDSLISEGEIPYIVRKTGVDEIEITFSNVVYHGNNSLLIPREDDKFIIFFRKGGGDLDNIPVGNINVDTVMQFGANNQTGLNIYNETPAIGGRDEINIVESIMSLLHKQRTVSISGFQKSKEEEDYKQILSQRGDVLKSISFGLKHTSSGLINKEKYPLMPDDVYNYIILQFEINNNISSYENELFIGLRDQIVSNFPLNFKEKELFGYKSYYAELPLSFVYENNIFLTKDERTYKETNIWSDFYNDNDAFLGEDKVNLIKNDFQNLTFYVFNNDLNLFWETINNEEKNYYIEFELLDIEENVVFNKIEIFCNDGEKELKDFVLEHYDIVNEQWVEIDNFNFLTYENNICQIDLDPVVNTEDKRFRIKDINDTHGDNEVQINYLKFILEENYVENATLSCEHAENDINYLKNDTDVFETIADMEDYIEIDIQLNNSELINIIEINTNIGDKDYFPSLISILTENNILLKQKSFNSVGEVEDINIIELLYPYQGQSLKLRLYSPIEGSEVSYIRKLNQIKLYNNISIINNISSPVNDFVLVSSNYETYESNNTFRVINLNGKEYVELLPIYSFNEETNEYETVYNIDVEDNLLCHFENYETERNIFNEEIYFLKDEEKDYYYTYIKSGDLMYDDTLFNYLIKISNNVEEEDFEAIQSFFNFIPNVNELKLDIEKKKYKIIVRDSIIINYLKNNNYRLYAHYIKETDLEKKKFLTLEEDFIRFLNQYNMLMADEFLKTPIVKNFSISLEIWMNENPYIENILNDIRNHIHRNYNFHNREFGDPINIEQIIGELHGISNYIKFIKVDYFGRSFNKRNSSYEFFNHTEQITCGMNEIIVVNKQETGYNENTQVYEITEGVNLIPRIIN